ncbi:MAG: hypothetical protein WC465_00760 [Patescibacteria group bacterium]
MFKFYIKIIIIIFCLPFALNLQPILAQTDTSTTTVDYNNLLSDEEAQDYDSMSMAEIQSFLQSKNSYLQVYIYSGYNPGPGEPISTDDAIKLQYTRARTAAEIIYNAAYEARINPRFLLTTLQKEQGLIEKSELDQRALDYAMGYYCFDGQACNPAWQGFGKQVRAAALQFRDYIDNIESRPYKPGIASTIDGQTVVPVNRITAAMYVYTPHLHGNKLFSSIWQRYSFGGALASIIRGIIPDGSLVKAADGNDTNSIYLIYDKKRWLFDSLTALVSRFDIKKVQSVEASEISKYTSGPVIKYPNYSILQGSDGQRYLIDGLQKRLIASQEVFRQLGFSVDEIIEVTAADLAEISDGPSLTKENHDPFEKLVRDSKSKGVYYIKDNIKYPIVDPNILSINFPNMKITVATPTALDKYNNGLPILLKDGNLIMTKANPMVYVISNGMRRHIADEATFKKLGYSWANIKVVSDRVLNLHEADQPISL